jgi:hypothetical protein
LNKEDRLRYEDMGVYEICAYWELSGESYIVLCMEDFKQEDEMELLKYIKGYAVRIAIMPKDVRYNDVYFPFLIY